MIGLVRSCTFCLCLVGSMSGTTVFADDSRIFDCDPIGPTSYIGVSENVVGVDEVYPRFKLKLQKSSIAFNKKFVLWSAGEFQGMEVEQGVFRVGSDTGSFNAVFDSNNGYFHASVTESMVVLSLGAKCELSEPF